MLIRSLPFDNTKFLSAPRIVVVYPDRASDCLYKHIIEYYIKIRLLKIGCRQWNVVKSNSFWTNIIICFQYQVVGSEMDKSCFVERERGATMDIHQWNIYMRDDAELSQDLLIPLAEIVNSLLTGILCDSVLYLLPVLSCAEDQIQVAVCFKII